MSLTGTLRAFAPRPLQESSLTTPLPKNLPVSNAARSGWSGRLARTFRRPAEKNGVRCQPFENAALLTMCPAGRRALRASRPLHPEFAMSRSMGSCPTINPAEEEGGNRGGWGAGEPRIQGLGMTFAFEIAGGNDAHQCWQFLFRMRSPEDKSVVEPPSRSVIRSAPVSPWWDCALIWLCWLSPLVLRPFQNVPFIDDWTYAWPVEWLLKNGKLKILQWSSSFNLIQALWGAIFCLPTGFSFAHLRFSTWILAGSCLCGLYLLLWDLKASRSSSFLGVAMFAAHPLFFSLSFTFMTDIPFLTMLVWSVFATVRGLEKKSNQWLLVAAAFAALSIGIRTIGIAMPVAAVLLIFIQRLRGVPSLKGLWLLVVIPIVACGLIMWWWNGRLQITVDLKDFPGLPKTRLMFLQYALAALPAFSLSGLIFTAGVIGVAIFPLTAACCTKATWKPTLLCFAAIVIAWAIATAAGIKFTMPLSSGSGWAWNGFNASQELIPNNPATHDPSGLAWLLLPAFASFAIFIAYVCSRSLTQSQSLLVCLSAVNFALIVILWLFHDRYAMVLFPVAISLLLSVAPAPRLGIAWPLIGLFAIFSVIGEYNVLKYNSAVWEAVTSLRDLGARDGEIDGGYVVNGWLQYAHPENAPRDEQGGIFVPGITASKSPLRYRISNQPQRPAKVLAVIPYPNGCGHRAHFMCCKCREGEAPAEPSHAGRLARREARPPHWHQFQSHPKISGFPFPS